jgi:alpha-beta hydrolase superfamily lysophospholipase
MIGGDMKSSTFVFQDIDGVSVFTYKWVPDGKKPKGIIQVSHGMQEHAGRYDDVALFMTEHGYGVYANDHRGHGKTSIAMNKQGILGPGGWDHTVQAMKRLTEKIKEELPGIPVFMLGQSWGSLLAQNYIERWGKELKGVALSGTTGKDPLLKIGHVLALQQARTNGLDTQAGILEKMAVGNLNKAFEPSRTPKDWLNRDNSEIDRYVADPYCGKPFPNTFFLELTRLLLNTWKAKNERGVPIDLPIYLFSGTMDPVGKFTSTVSALAKRYRSNAVKDVTHRFYNDARHDILRETNRTEVLNDLLGWLNSHL